MTEMQVHVRLFSRHLFLTFTFELNMTSFHWQPAGDADARRAATLCRALSQLSRAEASNEQIKQF